MSVSARYLTSGEKPLFAPPAAALIRTRLVRTGPPPSQPSAVAAAAAVPPHGTPGRSASQRRFPPAPALPLSVSSLQFGKPCPIEPGRSSSGPDGPATAGLLHPTELAVACCRWWVHPPRVRELEAEVARTRGRQPVRLQNTRALPGAATVLLRKISALLLSFVRSDSPDNLVKGDKGMFLP